jgi:zinc and cadmium transporter
MDRPLAPWSWTAVGFVAFFVLEQVLHWHHCHRPASEHRRPLSWLVLVADGIHNFVGGVAVAGSFLVDIRLGVVAWLAAVAHEVPQELGDFGILVHSGWRPRTALFLNVVSALTFPLGGILAWAASHRIDTSFLLPFAAGNFLYIGAVDLVPELGRSERLATNLAHVGWFSAGLLLLYALRVVL